MRLDDWPERLSKVFAASRERQFDLGEHDCCLFVADCVDAIIGVDVAKDWRGEYSEVAVGLALAGVKTLAALPRKFFKPIAPALAWRGDVALAKIGDPGNGVGLQPMLLVFDGVWLRGPCGLAAPRELASRAWRVI